VQRYDRIRTPSVTSVIVSLRSRESERRASSIELAAGEVDSPMHPGRTKEGADQRASVAAFRPTANDADQAAIHSTAFKRRPNPLRSRRTRVRRLQQQ